MYKTVGCANCGIQKPVEEMKVIYPLTDFPAYYICNKCVELNTRKEIDNLVNAIIKLMCRHHVGSGHDGNYMDCREPACFGARLSITPYSKRS